MQIKFKQSIAGKWYCGELLVDSLDEVENQMWMIHNKTKIVNDWIEDSKKPLGVV